MTYAHMLRSPHARARVARIDTSRASELPGVFDVMTCFDVAAKGDDGKEPLLSDDVRFAGQPVAVVVAADPDIARDALDLLEVEYDVLPFVCEPEAALRDDAVKVQPDAKNNLKNGKPRVKSRGDVEAGFAEADVVTEVTVRTPTALH